MSLKGVWIKVDLNNRMVALGLKDNIICMIIFLYESVDVAWWMFSYVCNEDVYEMWWDVIVGVCDDFGIFDDTTACSILEESCWAERGGSICEVLNA